MAKIQHVSLRLWVCNQDVIGADSDYTDGHLEAANWHKGNVVIVEATEKALTKWWRDVYLPLRKRVAKAGWGDLTDDDGIETIVTEQPFLIASVANSPHWCDSTLTYFETFCLNDNMEAWVKEILELIAKENNNA